MEAYDAVVSHAYGVIGGLDKPLVARVRGFAVGGGFELMQLCDLRIASDSARFAMTPARLGLGYKLDDVQLLVDRIGPRAAREMLFTGRLFDAAEAERMGLVTRVVPAEDLDAAVDTCAAEIAANGSALDPGHQGGDRGGAQAAGGPRPGALRRPRRGVPSERGLPGRPARLRGAASTGVSRAVGLALRLVWSYRWSLPTTC